MHKDKQPEEKAVFGRIKNSLHMGIVGFPNVGKSSTFNLFSKVQVKAENYPFCTIDPTACKVPVPDARFDTLAETWKPKSVIPAFLTINDIAGLVPNAHKGEGLGNAFLSHIQAVDGIFHMVRAFSSSDVMHIEGEVDPIRDMAVISEELIMKDLISVEKKLEELTSKINRFNNDPDKRERDLLMKVKEVLEQRKWIKDCEWANKEVLAINDYLFFTAKPVVYLVNISANDFKTKKNKWLLKIKNWVESNVKGTIIPFSVEHEEAVMRGEIESPSMINKIIKTGYELLNLIHFFTAGDDEVRAWTVRKGTKAPQAGGVIHSDFEKGFICIEVMKYEDFIEYGSEAAVKNAGKYKQLGKDYVIQDGDIVNFKFNPPKANKKK